MRDRRARDNQIGVELDELELRDGQSQKIDSSKIAQQQSEERPSSEDGEYPTGIRLTFLIFALMLSMFLGALDGTILAQAIPSITASFGGIGDIAWYSTAYAITNTAFKMVWGTAYKDFRIKPTFLISMAIFELGNIVCATAQSSAAIIVGRLISGLGGSGLMSGSFVIAALSVRKKYRPLMMGVTSFAFGLSSVTGPVLGGGLVDALSWRWCFWINLPLGALAAGLMLILYQQLGPHTPRHEDLRSKIQAMDINGGFLIGGSMVCFVFAMHWLGPYPASSPQVTGSLVGCGLLGLAFAINERFMGSKAMLQLRLLRNRQILANCTFAFFFAGVLYPLEYILPIQFQSLGGLSAAASGVRMIPLLITVSVFTLLANGILTWKPTFGPFFVVGGILGTAGAVTMYLLNGQAPAGPWIGAEVLTSTGVGLALQLPIMANVACVGAEDISVATSLALFFENIGSTIFVSASEAALTNGVVQSISNHASNVNLGAVINAGGVSLRSTFSKAQLPAVLAAYGDGCKQSHLVPVACGSAAALVAISDVLPWASRRMKRWLGNSPAV